MKIFHDLNEKCHVLTRIYYNFKGNKRGLIAGLHFTPLESPAPVVGSYRLAVGMNPARPLVSYGVKIGFFLERTRGLKLHLSPPVGRSKTF
jgi:hypothetical protein